MSFARLVLLAGAVGACVPQDDPPRVELPLPIPPVLAPTSSDPNADYYTITQRPGLQQVFPFDDLHRAKTPIEGYEGLWPGPTLQVRRGRPIVVRQINQLDHPVVVHNHGHKAEAASDGYPTATIPQGDFADYHYPNDQPAGTYWLHDHTMNETSHNLWRGLSMFYIIHDDFWDRLNLPSGDYDVPLLIQDRSFNADDTLYYPGPPDNPGPEYGDTLCVNGVRTPRFEVAARKYLFRVLNGSDHRIYRLYLQRVDSELGKDVPAIPFTVVASDGGLLPNAVQLTNLEMAPAERYAIVIDFSAFPVGTSLMMHNGGPDADLPPVFATGVRSVALPDIMRFDITRTESDTSSVPADGQPLLPIERLDPAQAVVTRQLVLGVNDAQNFSDAGDWYINGNHFDPARIDFHAKLGTTEIWEIENPNGANHVLHVHLVQFQVLDNGVGSVSQPELQGWKDSILVRAYSTVRIILRWESYTGIYVFHCHVLGHEDNAMMGQVEISD